jgi:hypothetical protein
MFAPTLFAAIPYLHRRPAVLMVKVFVLAFLIWAAITYRLVRVLLVIGLIVVPMLWLGISTLGSYSLQTRPTAVVPVTEPAPQPPR